MIIRTIIVITKRALISRDIKCLWKNMSVLPPSHHLLAFPATIAISSAIAASPTISFCRTTPINSHFTPPPPPRPAHLHASPLLSTGRSPLDLGLPASHDWFFMHFCPGTMTTHAESINSDLQRLIRSVSEAYPKCSLDSNYYRSLLGIWYHFQTLSLVSLTKNVTGEWRKHT